MRVRARPRAHTGARMHARNLTTKRCAAAAKIVSNTATHTKTTHIQTGCDLGVGLRQSFQSRVLRIECCAPQRLHTTPAHLVDVEEVDLQYGSVALVSTTSSASV
eukprot:3787056-Pleurochrysis_carterae.AAC.1